jgi:hypothetical protein
MPVPIKTYVFVLSLTTNKIGNPAQAAVAGPVSIGNQAT